MITPITIAGGVVRDAELRFTPTGAAVAEFTLAQSDHKKTEAGEWEKTRALYLPVTIWNDTRGQNPVPWAEMAAELRQGDRVAVSGKLHTRSWEAKDGTNRSRVEFLADALYVMPPTPSVPQGATQGGFAAQGSQQQAAAWGQPAQTGPAADENPPF